MKVNFTAPKPISKQTKEGRMNKKTNSIREQGMFTTMCLICIMDLMFSLGFGADENKTLKEKKIILTM